VADRVERRVDVAGEQRVEEVETRHRLQADRVVEAAISQDDYKSWSNLR